MKNLFIKILLFTLFIPNLTAQNYKFGKVSKNELSEEFYPNDSSAKAAILYKKRITKFLYEGNTGWTLQTKVHQRIKLYQKDGFDNATKQIKLYNRGGANEQVSIKAYTYNLVGDKIEKTKLKNSEVFLENVNKNWENKKFTMPNLKEGSVIEWEYTITSPFHFNLDDMQLQYSIPIKYIDSKISIPEYFDFKYLPNSYYPVKVNISKKQRTLNYSYRSKDSEFGSARTTLNKESLNILETVYETISKNVPAIKNETFTNNINNYKSKVSFELTAIKMPNSQAEYYNTTWTDVTKNIYKSSNFGNELNKTNYFKDDIATIIGTPNEKLAIAFQLVKQKIKWNGNYGIYTNAGVKNAYKEGVGNVAEVNLTLVNMLRQAGLKANPILISTRSHGIPMFPTTEGFNYVIAGVESANGVILLDATEVNSIPNVLPLRDLNWNGRLIRKDGSSISVSLFPNSHTSEKVFVKVNLNENGMNGNTRIAYDQIKALNYRNSFMHIAKEDLITKLEKDFNGIEIEDIKVMNEEKLGKPIVLMMKFYAEDILEEIGNKIYFSPLLYLAKKENPFRLETRNYPVDYGTPWLENFSISILIPEGYTVESKPENVAFALPDNLGSYKFQITVKNKQLQILSDLKINQPIIGSNYYPDLKEFYKQMINKQLEKVVLTKIE